MATPKTPNVYSRIITEIFRRHYQAGLICRPIAAQFVADDAGSVAGGHVIALFELQDTDEGIKIVTERHYRLVSPDSVSEADLASYRQHSAQ